jgi:hypothetical protein
VTRTTYRNRKAVQIENETLRATVLEEGGHLAELFHKQAKVNPLWTPPWPSIEPSAYDPGRHPEYGADAESKLLAGIMGHNLCLDLFGGPTPEEAAAGITVHGEGSVARYEISGGDTRLTQRCRLEAAQLDFARELNLQGQELHFRETVTNLAALDRPIAWTQHVTLGPPFLERGVTRLDLPGTRARTYESDFTGGKGLMKIATDFDWPRMPARRGEPVDLRVYWRDEVAAGFVTVLLDPHRETVGFRATSKGLELRYDWKQTDFPWIGIWDECNARTDAPWNGRTITRGLEFGVSPYPESRRAMIERKELFGVPTYRWIGARKSLSVEYRASLRAV